MRDAHFYIYNIGHGLCTLLMGKSRAERKEVPYIGIFDCGYSAENPNSDLTLALSDMKDKIIGSTKSDTKFIDVVVISHQDVDHWRLLLNLFAMLCGEKDGGYENVCFRWETERAWMLRAGLKNSSDFYIIEDNKITFKSYARYYLCDVSVEYRDQTAPIRFNINLTLRNTRKKAGYNIISVYNDNKNYYNTEFYVNGSRRKSGTISKVNKEILRHLLVQIHDDYLLNDPEAVTDALYNLMAAFTDNMQNQLFNGLQSGNEITSVFKRVILGGDQIQPEYERLIDFLRSICTYIMGNAGTFYREKDGAYIILEENKYPAFAIRSFPAYAVAVPSNQVTVIRNLTSVVVQYNITAEKILLLPGDVTVHAFLTIMKYVGNIRANRLKLFLAPHHGSDKTNFFIGKNNPKEPLYYLFNYIKQTQAFCNLVISGYNSKYVHPGQSFTVSAMNYFREDDGNLHPYAYAFAKAKKKSDGLKRFGNAAERIFTTNILENQYFDLSLADEYNRIQFMPLENYLMKNSLRIIPPDDSFI